MNMRKSVLFLAALLVSLASYSQNFQDRWTIGGKGELAWNIDGRVPHSDFIEMSGQMVSTVVRYEVAADSSLNIDLSVVWPMLRTIPNDTHASLNRHFGGDFISMVECGKKPLGHFVTKSVTLDGTLKTEEAVSSAGGTLSLSRILFPSVDKPAFCSKYVLKNISGNEMKLEIPSASISYDTPAPDGAYGAYHLMNKVISSRPNLTLRPGEECTFYSVITGAKEGEDFSEIDVEKELSARRALVEEWRSELVLDTPDPVLNAMFSFAKVRASESIFKTKGGLMHGPGGESYYAAIWANDQAEYVGPFFPFLGYSSGNEASFNAYRHFARYMNVNYAPVPSSIIAEGVDVWNGAGDRGDAAMLACGASRFALALGDRMKAEELWVFIEWCLEYCHRHINADGVVLSDSDELEGRFPSGKANLCTSTLYYDALNSAAYLGKALGKPYDIYVLRAKMLSRNIEKYFGANVEGYETYRYYDGNDKLRSWICIPLTVGIFDRRDGTLNALFDKLWTGNGLLSQSGTTTYWDRSTLYALRGAFFAGDTQRALEHLTSYSRTRLLGEHVPYAVEAWPEGSQRQLSAESGLYCRIFTEGMFGIRPTGLRSFDFTPRLPSGWDKMSLRDVKAFASRFDIEVERDGDALRVKVITFGKSLINKKIKQGDRVSVTLE